MSKKLLFLLPFALGLLLLLSSSKGPEVEDIKGEKQSENIIVGYCETFERYALDFARGNNMQAKKFSSSTEALQNLKSGIINHAVIGRKAYSFEIDETIEEIPLEDLGFTLISNSKGFVEYSELNNLEIHTYIPEDEVKGFLPENTNMVFHMDIEEALANDIVLIKWADFREEFELFIPIDGEKKVEKFRTPMLYTRSPI